MPSQPNPAVRKGLHGPAAPCAGRQERLHLHRYQPRTGSTPSSSRLGLLPWAVARRRRNALFVLVVCAGAAPRHESRTLRAGGNRGCSGAGIGQQCSCAVFVRSAAQLRYPRERSALDQNWPPIVDRLQPMRDWFNGRCPTLWGMTPKLGGIRLRRLRAPVPGVPPSADHVDLGSVRSNPETMTPRRCTTHTGSTCDPVSAFNQRMTSLHQ